MVKPDNLKVSNYELILTENCNLRCKYCFDDAFSNRTACNYDFKMSMDIIPDILKFIEFTRVEDTVLVSFFGGEPMMNWDFIVEFVKAAEGHNIRFSTNSNIVLLDSEKIDFLVEHDINVIVSIDGTRRSHNINRVNLLEEGNWDATVKILPELMTKFNKPLVAMMVVSNNNVEYLEESYEFLAGVGMRVNILYNFNVEYTEEQYLSIETQLNSLFNIKKYHPYIDAEKRTLNKDFHQQSNYCVMPENSMTIVPNGKLFFCHQLAPKMYEIDENFSEYYGDIWKGYYNKDYYRAMTKRIDINEYQENKNCENCKAKLWCKGGCIAANKHQMGNYEDLNPILCRINLIIHKIFME